MKQFLNPFQLTFEVLVYRFKEQTIKSISKKPPKYLFWQFQIGCFYH